MGLALGRFIYEVRDIPYPEFKRWKTFFLLEPFGFVDDEYRTGAVLAAINNSNAQKKKDQKPISKFMRDMPKEILAWFRKEKDQRDTEYSYSVMTSEEKESFLERRIATLFGAKKRK